MEEITRRKVLILAHLYHASPRIPGIARYLSSFGWEPVILTPPIRGWSGLLSEPTKEIRKYARVEQTDGYEVQHDSVGLVATAIRERVKRGTAIWCMLRLGHRAIATIWRFLHMRYLELRWFPDKERNWIPHVLRAGRSLLGDGTFDALVSTSSPVSAHIAASHLSREYRIPWVADLRDLWTQNHNYSFSPIRRFVSGDSSAEP